jgi:pimeloyl-ACP methyl ester carboxylesterase
MTEFATRDGIKLAYERSGAGDPPIVFVHGWACDRSYFAPQVEHFGSSHSVVAVDLRGHGESDRPEPGPGVYSIEEFASDVLAVAADAGFDRPIVIGHSLGGVVTLACASRPGAVRAAVMVDPAPIVNEPIKAFLAQAAESAESDDDASYRAGFVGSMFLPSDVVRRDEIINGMTLLPPAIAGAALRGIAEFDGARALSAVDVPLLSIGAAMPTNSPEEFRASCPAMMIGQTVGAGHFNQLEAPDQVNAMIERFFGINGL